MHFNILSLFLSNFPAIYLAVYIIMIIIIINSSVKHTYFLMIAHRYSTTHMPPIYV